MAYGSIYEFLFNSNNGADVKIVILKRGYNGPTMQRPLGRAPIMRRERNGCILGTSLELYAECYVDGEYAQLYTSSADEYRVEVYINQVFMWVGYVSPELYAEPDIAPPYDVRIIATDGLGELKNHEFQSADSAITLDDHISQMLSYTSLDLDYRLVSQLSYKDSSGFSSPESIFNLSVNLSNHNGHTCYDVIQNILASMNMVLTQDQKTWKFIRETDVYSLLDDHYSVAFGHSTDDWWTIGNLSTDIIPAKRQVVVSYEDSYKDTLLGNSYMTHEESWDMDNSYYDDIEQGYILRSSGSAISQSIAFQYGAVRRQLFLRVKARCLTDIDSDKPSRLGVRIRMTGGVSSSTSREFYLAYGRPQGYERYIPIWSSDAAMGGGFIRTWASPKVNFGDPEIEEISIILPFFIPQDNGHYTHAYADSISVELFNPDDTFPICIYECVLTQYIRNKGVRNTLLIDNGARECENDIESIINSSKKYGLSAAITMKGILIADEDITEWSSASQSGDDLLMLIGRDYAQSVALPRMRYKGTLNVPNTDSPKIPILFVRDNTYYLLNTYSYDLYNDEIEVELISIPTADIILESENIEEIPAESNGNTGSSGGGSGGGGGEIDILNNWDAYDPTANQVLGANLGIDLYEWIEWIVGEGWGDSIDDIYDTLNLIDGYIDDIYEKLDFLYNNGTGGGGSIVYEGITGIFVNGQKYEDTDDDNVIVLPDYPTTVAELTDSADYATVAELEAINDDIADLAERVGGVEGSITTLGSRIGDAEDDIVVLDGKVGDAEGKITALEAQDEIITGIIDDISDDIAGIDSRLGVAENDILALQTEDERLAGLIEAVNTIAGMFSWDNEEHTRIRTDFELFSKKTISSGGKAAPSGEGGGGSIDLSDYATIDYVDSNFLPATYDNYHNWYEIDANIYVGENLYAFNMDTDYLYSYGDFWAEGDIGTDGKLVVGGDATVEGTLTALNINVANEFTVDGIVVCDIVTIASLECTDELYASYVEIETLVLDSLMLGTSYIYMDYDGSGMLTIDSQSLNVTGDLVAPAILDIYDRLNVIEARLGI